MNHLQTIDFVASVGSEKKHSFQLTYQVYGLPLHHAPIILVNHSLTGNSQVTGPKGWWKSLIGVGGTIDLNCYTVIAFNIPGNDYLTTPIWSKNYKELSTKSVAQLFWQALDALSIKKLFAVIGGSLGGAIAWEMSFLRPESIEYLIPIATHHSASDWVIANVWVQDRILNHSIHPIEDARSHAMLLYRTPESLASKFKKTQENQRDFEVENWLKYHGSLLHQRFSISAYRQMNYLLRTIGVDRTDNQVVDYAKNTTAKIHIIAINSDYMFPHSEQVKAYLELKTHTPNVSIHSIDSIHGHDAFLIEYDQLNKILNPILENESIEIWR